MRDLVPPEAGQRRALGRTIADVFASFGYAPVSTPPFELESVMLRALEDVDARTLLRFVDAETGEVVMLRPDITPQIARVVASRLRDHPPPLRLSYEGHVVRRRRGRARTQRQIAQAGVECIGVKGTHADVEVIELASRALTAAGLGAHRIELNLTPLTGALLDHVDADLRGEARAALARKDGAAIDRVLRGTPRDVHHGVRAALELLGDHEVLPRARRLFSDRTSRALLDELEAIHDALASMSLGAPVGFDLGEARGFGYYTGASFAILAEGPGEPVAVGGRYDDLLGRFGRAMPATGVAIDLDHLDWALGAHAPAPHGPSTYVLAGSFKATLSRALRAAGVAIAALPGASLDEARAYATAWSHAGVVVIDGDRATMHVGTREERVQVGELAARLGSTSKRSVRTKR
jgi:ATP phosphoribosyltransferase regulatory subunit